MAFLKRNALVRSAAIGGAIAITGGFIYLNHVDQVRERAALDKISVLKDEHSLIGQSYARTLLGIEKLRSEFRRLVDTNPSVPTGKLRALADEATLKVIESQGLSRDVDLVVRYVAELDTCIAERSCDQRVATGQQSPLAALRNWEQWYRPYLQARRGGAGDEGQQFYRYLDRAPA